MRREKEYITHARFVSSALFSFFENFSFFLIFFTTRYCALLRTSLPVAGIPRVCATLRLCCAHPGDFTVRFCARPACGRDPACLRHAAGLLRANPGDFIVRFCARPACGRDRKGRVACVFACKNTGGLCRSPGEPGFCAALRNKKPPGLFLVLFFF